jgi:hypothetical protein
MGEIILRVTNQMLRQSAHKAGLQLDQTSLLDVLNSGDSSDNLMSGVGTKNPTLAKLQKGHYTEIEKSSEKLNQYASSFASTDKNSILAKAEKSGSTKDVVANIKDLVASYNTTVSKLKKTDSNLNKYYQQQMTALVSTNKDKLKTVGITQAKDGTMSVDTKTLEKASLKDLKAAFGSSNEFAARMAFVSGKVEQNAAANLESKSNLYNANGKNSNQNATNRYNFLG